MSQKPEVSKTRNEPFEKHKVLVKKWLVDEKKKVNEDNKKKY